MSRDADASPFGRDREGLEEHLEDACIKGDGRAPGPWLGQVISGIWEIRDFYVAPALHYILAGLERSGHVQLVESEGPGGRSRKTWIAANRYKLNTKKNNASNFVPETKNYLLQVHSWRCS